MDGLKAILVLPPYCEEIKVKFEKPIPYKIRVVRFRKERRAARKKRIRETEEPRAQTVQKTEIIVCDEQYGINQLFDNFCDVSDESFYYIKSVNNEDIHIDLDLDFELCDAEDSQQLFCEKPDQFIPRQKLIQRVEKVKPMDNIFEMIGVTNADIRAFKAIKEQLQAFEKSGDTPLYTLLNILLYMRIIDLVDGKITKLVDHLTLLGDKKINFNRRLSLNKLIGEIIQDVEPYKKPDGIYNYVTIGAYRMSMHLFYRDKARRLLTLEMADKCGYLNILFTTYQLGVWIYKVKSIVQHMICLHNLITLDFKTPCNELLVKLEHCLKNIVVDWRKFQHESVVTNQKNFDYY